MSQTDAIGSRPSSVDEPATNGRNDRAEVRPGTGQAGRPTALFAVLYSATLAATVAAVFVEPLIGRTVMAMIVVAIVAVFSLISWTIFVRPGAVDLGEAEHKIGAFVESTSIG